MTATTAKPSLDADRERVATMQREALDLADRYPEARLVFHVIEHALLIGLDAMNGQPLPDWLSNAKP